MASPTEIVQALIAGGTRFENEFQGALATEGMVAHDIFKSSGKFAANLGLISGVVTTQLEGVWTEETVYAAIKHLWKLLSWETTPRNPYQAQIDARAAAERAAAEKEARRIGLENGTIRPLTEFDRSYTPTVVQQKAAYQPAPHDETLPAVPSGCPSPSTKADIDNMPHDVYRYAITGPHGRAFTKRVAVILKRHQAALAAAAAAEEQY
jgi:hypothetical protein